MNDETKHILQMCHTENRKCWNALNVKYDNALFTGPLFANNNYGNRNKVLFQIVHSVHFIHLQKKEIVSLKSLGIFKQHLCIFRSPGI